MNRIALIVSLVLPLLLILGCGNDIPETTPRFGTAVPPRSSASLKNAIRSGSRSIQ